MGYLTKLQEAKGRKVLKLSVTEEGKRIYKEILPIILSVWEETIDGITDDELENFNNVQLKLRKNLLGKVNIQI